MPPEPNIRFTVAARFSELRPASENVRRFLSNQSVDCSVIFAIETVLEELATNAIKYGFRNGRPGSIDFEASATGERVEFVIEDDGDPFDPTMAPDPKVDRPLEDMPIGGLGIHLVRSVTDGFEYQRVSNRNRMRVWIDCRK